MHLRTSRNFTPLCPCKLLTMLAPVGDADHQQSNGPRTHPPVAPGGCNLPRGEQNVCASIDGPAGCVLLGGFVDCLLNGQTSAATGGIVTNSRSLVTVLYELGA